MRLTWSESPSFELFLVGIRMKLRILIVCHLFAWIGLTVPNFVGCRGGDNAPELDDAAHLFLESQRAFKAGDRAKGLELLNQSIAAKPYAWSLLERGKLHAEDGNDSAAQADVKAGLELDPDLKDLQWLQQELQKSPDKRFKTKPPSALK